MRKLPDIPESEARGLLARPLRCEDCGVWRQGRSHTSTLTTQTGLVDWTGKPTWLFVELKFSQSLANTKRRNKANNCHYVFSVYSWNQSGVKRVYQLDIGQSAKFAVGAHRGPHEHMGDHRTVGKEAWRRWSYGQVLAYFCQRTNVTFNPFPEDPALIQSKGKKS